MVILRTVRKQILVGDLLHPLKRGVTGLRGLLKGNRQREIWKYNHNSVSGGSGDPSSRISCLPQLQTVTESSVETAPTDSEPMTVLVGEQLLDDYRVIDLPDDPSTTEATPSSPDETHLFSYSLHHYNIYPVHVNTHMYKLSHLFSTYYIEIIFA